ncbi:anti-sigma factor domain-containing protein [Nocardioides sp. R-C-SC26]|uniref:anti-sigma factor n=1 Tax=Nocardioides sp. R-C-SC26 TaxID=2870414 RepID=UPI001E5D2071|nr:anti-sigma factor [Nocardioides sp. R-C-SC26]
MMRDIHALSGAYAVDALDDLERADFERHLAECPACREEVDSLREAAALLPASISTTPPPSLRDSVLAGITTVRPLPPLTPAPSADEPAGGRDVRPLRPAAARAERRWFPQVLAVAAALVIVAGAGVAVTQPWADDPTSEVALSVTDQILQSDDAERVSHSLGDGAEVTVVRSRQHNRAVVITDNLPAAPEGHAYELWLQRGGLMIPAGQIAGGTTSSTVLLDGAANKSTAVGITIELAGTKPIEPSDDVLAVVPFEQA